MRLPKNTKKDPQVENRFIAGLDQAIKFHRTNPNDPHGISAAVVVAILEVRNAAAKAYGLPQV